MPGGSSLLSDERFAPKIISFCPRDDSSRHPTLVQNKAVNGKSADHSIAVSAPSQGSSTSSREEWRNVVFVSPKDEPRQTRQKG